MKYVALLRGINVGGKNLIKMPELKSCLEIAGFESVSTYIMSGNVFFSSDEQDEVRLARKIEKTIETSFDLPVRVVVFSHNQMQRICAKMPKDWGQKDGWQYNTLFIFPPYTAPQIIKEIGELKPGIEIALPTDGAILQTIELKSFGRSQLSKIVGKPIYKQITVRNLNTTRKLLELLNEG